MSTTVSSSPRPLRKALLSWYERNARPLPWRRSRDPYRVWLAEVMLQQTRMAVVLPAYERFLGRFPDLKTLAAADEEQVLSLWSGLGYYSRARALHRAARILEANGGSFPRELDAALRLPGVGRYTAAAVLSIAFDRPIAALDGNVVRVLSRLRCLPRPDRRGEPHGSLAAELLDPKRPGDWNQALMELGEVVCLPRAPRCVECPLRSFCTAFASARVEAHPPPRPRRRPEQLCLSLLLLQDRRGRLLLERGRLPYLRHLWLPPARVSSGPAAPFEPGASTCGGFRHAIVHRRLQVTVFHKIVPSGELQRRARTMRGAVEARVFDVADLAGIGRSSLLSKALAKALPRLSTMRSRTPTLGIGSPADDPQGRSTQMAVSPLKKIKRHGRPSARAGGAFRVLSES
jgi:A/G-specific adenine glycosylase